MKQIIKKSGYLLTLTVLLTVLIVPSGCEKLLDVESTHIVNEQNNWESIQDARSALLGTYGLLRAALADNNAHWLYGELRMGDFTSSSRRDLDAIINGELNTPYPVLESLSNWRRFYAVINSASLFIDRADEVLENDAQYTQLNYQVDIAQMRAMRAFVYFYMARIWGDVPLVTSSHDGSFEKNPRTSQEKVLAYAESEMLAAAKVLPYRYGLEEAEYFAGTYYGENSGRWNGVLFTRISAYSILAHIAAWDGRYLSASVYADFVLKNYDKSGVTYTTTDELTKSDGFFYGQSTSQIFGLGFSWVNKEASVTGHIEDLALAFPLVNKPVPDIYVPSDTVLSIFDEALDERFSIDSAGVPVTGYFTDFSGVKPVFSKIKVIRAGTTDGSFPLYSSTLVFTRLEEIALLYAESMAVLGNTQAAIEALDIVRQKRGLQRYFPSNGDLLNNILKERRRELMGEGWRWYDLVRYHRIKKTDPVFNDLIDNKGIYWPIADAVLTANPLLDQYYWN